MRYYTSWSADTFWDFHSAHIATALAPNDCHRINATQSNLEQCKRTNIRIKQTMQLKFLEKVAMYLGWKAPCKCTQASILQHRAGQSKSRAKAKAEEQDKKRNITSLGEHTFICRAPFLAFSFLFSLSPMSQCQSKSLMQLRATNSKQQTTATNCGWSPKKSMKALMPLTIYGS